MEIVGQWWEKGLTNDQINKIKCKCQQKQCQYILIRFNSITSFKQKPKKQKIKCNNKMIFDRKNNTNIGLCGIRNQHIVPFTSFH